jgi:predicted PurR-regulated permease PerM
LGRCYDTKRKGSVACSLRGLLGLRERKAGLMNGKMLTNRGFLHAALVSVVLLFALFLVWRFLAGVASAVLLLLVGVLLGVALSAPVEALRRWKVPRAVSSPLIVVSVLAALGVVGYLFLPQLDQQGSQLSTLLPDSFSNLVNQIERLASRFGLSLDFGAEEGFSLVGLVRRLTGGILGLFSSLVFAVAGVVVAIFLGIYLAADPGPVVGWVVRLFPSSQRSRAREILAESRSALLSWLLGRLLSMAIIAVLSTVALYFIGIPAPVLLGLFAGLVAFVPYIGPIISVIPPALLGLLGEPIHALYVIVAYIVIQQIESNVLTPLIMQKVASVHPAVVIAAVTLLGTVFGFLGALLALPIAVVAAVLVEELWFRRLEGGSEASE